MCPYGLCLSFPSCVYPRDERQSALLPYVVPVFSTSLLRVRLARTIPHLRNPHTREIQNAYTKREEHKSPKSRSELRNAGITATLAKTRVCPSLSFSFQNWISVKKQADHNNMLFDSVFPRAGFAPLISACFPHPFCSFVERRSPPRHSVTKILFPFRLSHSGLHRILQCRNASTVEVVILK